MDHLLRLENLPRTIELVRAGDGAAELAYVDQRRLPRAHEGQLTGKPAPVSYTHLDVYKRQRDNRAAVWLFGEQLHEGGFLTLVEIDFVCHVRVYAQLGGVGVNAVLKNRLGRMAPGLPA